MKLFRARHDKLNEPERMEPFYHLNHPRPRTRRQFLGQGFIAGAAMVASPSLFGLLSKSGNAQAQAASCGLTAGGAGRIPFICIDLAGGANMVGSNVLVGLQGGFQNFLDLDGYEKQGLPAAITPVVDPLMIDTSFGLPFHATSAFLLGMLDKTTQPTRDGTNGAVFCTRSSNDTQNNLHNPMYGIAASGSAGGLLTLVGTEPTDSGGNSMNPPMWFNPAIRPTKVDRPQDATGLVDTGRLVQLLDTEGADAVMNAIERMSNRKIDKMEQREIAAACAKTYTAQEIDDGVLHHLGVAMMPSELLVPSQVLPSADSGKYSRINAEGEERVRKDLGLQTEYQVASLPFARYVMNPIVGFTSSTIPTAPTSENNKLIRDSTGVRVRACSWDAPATLEKNRSRMASGKCQTSSAQVTARL